MHCRFEVVSMPNKWRRGVAIFSFQKFYTRNLIISTNFATGILPQQKYIFNPDEITYDPGL